MIGRPLEWSFSLWLDIMKSIFLGSMTLLTLDIGCYREKGDLTQSVEDDLLIDDEIGVIGRAAGCGISIEVPAVPIDGPDPINAL